MIKEFIRLPSTYFNIKEYMRTIRNCIYRIINAPRRKYTCLRKFLINRLGGNDKTLRAQVSRAKGEGTVATFLCIHEDKNCGMGREHDENKFKQEMFEKL